jgi:site-specific recombinase XerC
MTGMDDLHLDMASLVVPLAGFLQATADPWDPYRLVDPSGEVVGPVAVYLRDLQAAGRTAATQRSYGMDLLRWFRFCWAIGAPWDQVTRSEARDFCRWIQIAAKPVSPHWREQRDAADGPAAGDVAVNPSARRTANPVTGKLAPGGRYAASTAAHCESVLRQFYDFHLEAGSGPMVNPFPLGRGRRGGRAGAHHNPMDAHRDERSGLFRPRLVQRIPRSIPDERFSELFAGLTCHRDRALVAFWVSTGARAAELLAATAGDAEAGQRLITVIRKGTRLMQQLPASPDAFVWLRLYQAQMQELVPGGLDQPLWWTLRRPFRPLTYHAAHRMFTRASAVLGANWTLHDLRHTAASRMARDPAMPLTDVQWVLGHARLSTTQKYVTPLAGDVITSVAAFHARRARRQVVPDGQDPDLPSSGYRPESLKILFGDAT